MAGTVTDLYEQHDIARFLVEDAEKMRVYVGLHIGRFLELRAVK